MGFPILLISCLICLRLLQDQEWALWSPHFPEYQRIVGTAIDNADTSETRGLIRGRLVVIGEHNLIRDHDKPVLDIIYYLLPPELRAQEPDDVGTIVWLQRGGVQVGQYGEHGSGAYIATCVACTPNSDDSCAVVLSPRIAARATFAFRPLPSTRRFLLITRTS